MNLPGISIRRPVFATVMSLVLTLLGVISYTRLSVREYPKIDPPVVSVRTVYPGASAEIIESQITRPIESALAGIEGIKVMKSISREEVSQITIEFVLNRDPDAAANDVRDRVARGRATIPEEALESIVQKIEADAQAVMWLAFSSDRHAPLEITDYADRFVKDRLQTLPGVATVIIGGERRYAMRIWLDRDRLAAFQLTPRDVEKALRAQNVDVPSGRIESRLREFTVLTETDLKTPDEFNRLILREVNGYPVRLSDVGYAEVGAEDDRNAVRVNGNPAVGLGIVKQSTANTLEVAQAIKTELPNISAGLPEGMRLQVAFDSSVFIDKSINAVYRSIAEAMILVVLVIFFFLRSFRATLIPFVTIPISLIGGFLFMYIMGFSINILTLLALVLAIGLVVDDAIVMMENIYRRIEGGMPRIQGRLGGKQGDRLRRDRDDDYPGGGFCSPGVHHRHHREALYRICPHGGGGGDRLRFRRPDADPDDVREGSSRHQAKQSRFYTVTERWFEGMNNGYRRLLAGALRARWLVVFLGLIFAAGRVFSFLYR
ncbi:MAG: efflux RND transporter permease subunit [Candidatus Manganitrophus sp.]|nr:MAG: efflux RND transporter permease subunit [Candidatus Manganitrophus sp.]